MTIEKVVKKKTKIQKLESKIADMQKELDVLNEDYYADLGKEVEEIFAFFHISFTIARIQE